MRCLADTSTPLKVLLAVRVDAAGRSIERRLRSAGFETTWATTLLEVRSCAEHTKPFRPQIVFLDLELPGCVDEAALAMIQDFFRPAAIVALGSRLGGERGARLLNFGILSLNKPVSADTLATLAQRLSDATRPQWPNSRVDAAPTRESARQLDALVAEYSKHRKLSDRQSRILGAYLAGRNDKEIASDCSCSEATIYEHWRRMARKMGVTNKADVVANFHRFLDGAWLPGGDSA